MKIKENVLSWLNQEKRRILRRISHNFKGEPYYIQEKFIYFHRETKLF